MHFIILNICLILAMAIISVTTSSKQTFGTYQLSDVNFKSGIRPIDANELSKVFELKGKAFKINTDKPPILKYGMIAQELESVFPGMVLDVNKRKYVDLTQLIPFILEILKAIKKDISQLKIDIEEAKKAAAKSAGPSPK